MNVSIDISNCILKTERTILRPFQISDLSDFYEYAKVDGVGEMAGWRHHSSINESRVILNNFIIHKKVFAIVYENKVIGSIGIEEYNEKRLPEFKGKKAREIGFVLSKDYWGLGLMTEVASRVMEYLFLYLGLDIIICSYFDYNKRSKRVQEKLNFKYYKTFEDTRLGEKVNLITNIIEKEDYLNSNKVS